MARHRALPPLPALGTAHGRARPRDDRGRFRARLTCVDPRRSLRRLRAARSTRALLADLPPAVDPCGENGEFHTFVSDGPIFGKPVAVRAGEVVTRDGFVFADLLPA